MNEVNYSIDQIEQLDPITKDAIMSFFNNVVCDEIGASTMPMKDALTGEKIENYYLQNRAVPRAFYRKDQFTWGSELVYHFDKYSVRLDPSFKEYILDYVKRTSENG